MNSNFCNFRQFQFILWFEHSLTFPELYFCSSARTLIYIHTQWDTNAHLTSSINHVNSILKLPTKSILFAKIISLSRQNRAKHYEVLTMVKCNMVARLKSSIINRSLKISFACLRMQNQHQTRSSFTFKHASHIQIHTQRKISTIQWWETFNLLDSIIREQMMMNDCLSFIVLHTHINTPRALNR